MLRENSSDSRRSDVETEANYFLGEPSRMETVNPLIEAQKWKLSEVHRLGSVVEGGENVIKGSERVLLEHRSRMLTLCEDGDVGVEKKRPQTEVLILDGWRGERARDI